MIRIANPEAFESQPEKETESQPGATRSILKMVLTIGRAIASVIEMFCFIAVTSALGVMIPILGYGMLASESFSDRVKFAILFLSVVIAFPICMYGTIIDMKLRKGK